VPYKDPEQAKAAKRRYYERNMEACKARAAAHKAKDPEREKARLRQWHADNKERSRAQVRGWKKANPEKVKASKDEYRASNPGLWAAYCGKRRAVKKQATPRWADHEKIARLYELAAVLNADGCAFEVDHIVPLNSPLVCGLHVENNLQLLPKVGNRSKGNRAWPDMP
jgi:hypothetical protein